MANPNRGEVWLVDMGYVGKRRPCLVLSILPEFQDRALVTVVIHTTTTRGSRFEVASAVKFLDPGAFDAQNLATLSQAKCLRMLGRLPADQLVAVETAVREWLSLP